MNTPLIRFLYRPYDKSNIEVARSLQRAIRATNSSLNIELRSFEEELENIGSPTLSPSLLLIADPSPASFEFLRTYWARLIRKKEEAPPAILLSFDSLQELIEKDSRFIIACSKGVQILTLPFSLKEITHLIEDNVGKKINVEGMKKYLKWSCELSQQLAHDLRNFGSPYSLLLGAWLTGDFKNRERSFDNAVNNLKERGFKSKELEVYHASIFTNFGEPLMAGDEEGNPLSQTLTEKRILLIDDEYESAGWQETLETIFGRKIEAVGDKSNAMKLLKEGNNHLLPYDLILLDLYLTDKDRQLSKDYEEGRNFGDLKKLSSLEVINYIRQSLNDPIPIILFTASNKAYNVEIMREAGADDYFPKEVHYKGEEAREYYKRFKGCIERLLSQEKMAIRRIWGGIKGYKKGQHRNKEKVVQFLKSAYEYLSCQHQHLRGCIIELGNALERYYGNQRDVLSRYRHPNHNKREDFIGFICYTIRSSAKHSSFLPTFEDALLTFLLALKCLEVQIEFDYPDPCPDFNLDKGTVGSMINTVCQDCSSPSCKLRVWGKPNEDSCKGTQESKLKRAEYLSNFKNLRSQVAKNNHTLFIYLYYVFKSLKKRWPFEETEKRLIKHIITKSGYVYPKVAG